MPRPKTEPRKRPKQARSRVLFDALIEATQRLLASEGVDAVTTARVAELAGVSIGSLYQYFPSREALIAAVIDRKLESDMSELLPVVERLRAAPLDEALAGLIEMALGFYRDETPLYREMIAAMALVDREEHVGRLADGFEQAIILILDPHRAAFRAELERCAWIIRTVVLACVREAAARRPEAFEGGLLAAQLEAMCRGLLGV